MTFRNDPIVEKLARLIEKFEGGQTNGEYLAIALVDSGILWELEQDAFNRGYETAVTLLNQAADEEQSE